jgi:hypothetical protein
MQKSVIFKRDPICSEIRPIKRLNLFKDQAASDNQEIRPKRGKPNRYPEVDYPYRAYISYALVIVYQRITQILFEGF